MRINADFSQRAAYVADDSRWSHSPESGVDRQMLDRIGGEVARATSLVRYAAASEFPAHRHPKGEEFLVLDGVFSDESGDYPAGCYVRNPPGSSHTPFSRDGCRILVKLRQFEDDDLAQFSVNCRDERAWQGSGGTLTLHTFGEEVVSMLRLSTGDTLDVLASDGGTELFVVEGALVADGKSLTRETWLRFPPGDRATLAVSQPATVWRKTGHLRSLV